MRSGLTALIALTALLATGSLAQTPQFSAQVRRITDGDTFRVYDLEPAIRIWGLDAPETDEPGGSEATQTLTRLIACQTLTC